MAWLQIHIQIGSGDADDVEALLARFDVLSITYADAADQPLFEPPPGETPLWNQLGVIALFETSVDTLRLDAELLQQFPSVRMRWEPVADQEWERVCRESFQPIPIGKRLWITPSWHHVTQPDAVNLMLDPGLAFGTGSHPTTALCLEWLEAQPSSHGRIIDYGCGSGILAIAAALLGWDHATAIDNDPQALWATTENSRLNGVDAKISTHLPDTLPEDDADLLIANILANPLVNLAPTFHKLLKLNGKLVLSGILSEQVEAVKAAYQPWIEWEETTLREGWARICGVKRNPQKPME